MAEGSGIRVVLSDDHALVRQGFRRILEDEPDITVVGEAGSGAEAVELARRPKPDVVVIDMAMPDMNGLHAARMILASGRRRVLISACTRRAVSEQRPSTPASPATS